MSHQMAYFYMDCITGTIEGIRRHCLECKRPWVQILESMSYVRRRRSDEELAPNILFISPPQLSGSAFYV